MQRVRLRKADPEEGLDVQVGLVDQAKEGFGLKLHFQSGEIFNRRNKLNEKNK